METLEIGAAVALAVAVATVVGTAPAAANHTGPGLNPLCMVTAYPSIVENPLRPTVCETRAEGQANTTVAGYPGPCTQEYPGSELCTDTEVGASAQAESDGRAHACLRVGATHGCGPELVTTQAPLP